MKCPHSLVEFHPRAEEKDIGDDVNGLWEITKYNCPNPFCKQIILFLKNHEGKIDVISNKLVLTGEIKTTLIWCFLRELLLLDQIHSASYHFQTS